MNLRIGLFLAATAIASNACTSIKQAPPVSNATIPADPKAVASAAPPAAATVPEAGPLPDFSSASADVNQADLPKEEDPNDPDEHIAPGLVPPNVDADDVREAVFRHMFASNASAQQSASGVYCLAVESDQDPPRAFLLRFKNVKTLIRMKSECDAGSNGVFDKKTHTPGLVFRIDHMKFKNAKHATVNGGYYEAGLSASGNTYTLEHKASGWVVTKDEMNWIS